MGTTPGACADALEARPTAGALLISCLILASSIVRTNWHTPTLISSRKNTWIASRALTNTSEDSTNTPNIIWLTAQTDAIQKRVSERTLSSAARTVRNVLECMADRIEGLYAPGDRTRMAIIPHACTTTARRLHTSGMNRAPHRQPEMVRRSVYTEFWMLFAIAERAPR